jgi:Protein of unknown function (DUF2442).
LEFLIGLEITALLKKVFVAFDTIEWESGADLDPEFVYEKCSKNPA